MHIKFLKHGSGSGKKAANYLTQERDHNGERRAVVEVLRGDPYQVAAVADSLDFDLRYRSAVIAWAPEDQPSPQQIDAVLDDFAKVAFAGMEDRISWSAVQHTDADNSVHVHVLIARVDLETGKSFNPAPPGWKKAFDPVRDFHNARNNWARPDDPELSRAVIKSDSIHNLPATAAKARDIINNYVVDNIKSGLIHNRSDIVTLLQDVGKITRQGKHYISVKPNGAKKAIRLKGGIYERDFKVERVRKTITADSTRKQGNSREDREKRIKTALQDIKNVYKKRVKYNQNRYGQRNKKYTEAVKKQLDNTVSDRSLSERRHRDGELQLDEIPVKQNHNENGTGQQLESADRQFESSISESTASARSADSAGSSGARRESDIAEESTASVAGNGWNVGYRTKKRKLKNNEIGYYMKNSNTELERFKTEIDLARYLEAQGWQKDIQSSCRSSVVLKNADEKVIIGRQRGHFVYKSTRVENDQGSIIDFIQHRQGLNIGQIRKILRPALKGDFQPLHDWKAPESAIMRAQERCVRGSAVFDFSYLEKRAIKRETISAYAPAIRQDRKTKDLMFMHRGMQGFSGYEIKKENGIGRFSAGGQKTFFPLQRARAVGKVSRLVVTETALDALSKAQLEGMRKDTAYISMAGNPSTVQLEQFKKLCNLDRIETVVLAQDNDRGGDQQAEKCRNTLKDINVEIEREIPAAGKDWNEQLMIEKEIEEMQQARKNESSREEEELEL